MARDNERMDIYIYDVTKWFLISTRYSIQQIIYQQIILNDGSRGEFHPTMYCWRIILIDPRLIWMILKL